jgi:hypothetical protein
VRIPEVRRERIELGELAAIRVRQGRAGGGAVTRMG